jgi:class 3 adenylate cyclase
MVSNAMGAPLASVRRGRSKGGEGGPYAARATPGVTVLGDTVNVAARLQAMAEPGSVVMSEAMHRLVQGLVETTFAGEHQFKGKTEPQRVYRLGAIRLAASRLCRARARWANGGVI